MLHDFSIDYELANECKYEYTLKPKTYMEKLKDRPPGIISGCGLLYPAKDEFASFDSMINICTQLPFWKP